jgi:uncharacterized Zn-finger protein
VRIPSITTSIPLVKQEEEPTATMRHREISASDLPLHCPAKELSLWNAHPRVYLPIEKHGEALCPYCGTTYRLKDSGQKKSAQNTLG